MTLISPRGCSLSAIREDIVQCKKTEAAGTIVYASGHKKMGVYPVSTLTRKICTESQRLRNQIISKAFSYNTYDSKIYFTSRDSCNLGKLVRKHY